MRIDRNTRVKIENAELQFRNFSGKPGKYNPPGRRNFCVFLDYNTGKDMEADGWNVRWLAPKDEGDNMKPYIQISVAYNHIPPEIYMISKSGKNLLNEETINILDWAEIKRADLIIRPHIWEMNGKTGVKAYAKTMKIYIHEDELEDVYYDVPDSAQGSIGGCGHCEACTGDCDCHGN